MFILTEWSASKFLSFPFLAGLAGWFIANALKPIAHKIKTGKWDISQMWASGGFPSSHSCMVMALISAIGFSKLEVNGNPMLGPFSPIFAVAATFGFIVMYDAFNVRLHSGRNNAATKKLIEELGNKGLIDKNLPEYQVELKDVLGHKIHEVIAGGLLGILIGFLFSNFLWQW